MQVQINFIPGGDKAASVTRLYRRFVVVVFILLIAIIFLLVTTVIHYHCHCFRQLCADYQINPSHPALL